MHMWGSRADLCEKLQGNIRLEGEYTCEGGLGGLVHMWGPRADLCEKLPGDIRLEGEYPCEGGPGG